MPPALSAFGAEFVAMPAARIQLRCECQRHGVADRVGRQPNPELAQPRAAGGVARGRRRLRLVPIGLRRRVPGPDPPLRGLKTTTSGDATMCGPPKARAACQISLRVALFSNIVEYELEYRSVSARRRSLQLVALTRPAHRSHPQRDDSRCSSPGRTFNPKVAGSRPARPIEVPANAPFLGQHAQTL